MRISPRRIRGILHTRLYLSRSGFTLPIATSKHPHLVRHKHSQHYRNPCYMNAHAEPDGLHALKSMDNLLYDAVASCLACKVSARPTARDFADYLTQLLEAMEKQKEGLNKESE